MFLRQSTASQEILLGPFLDDTDGKTAETALTIANTDIKIWKSGGTTESNKNSGGATHIASGRYYAVLDATDCDTVGLLEVSVSVSGALPVRRQFYVLEEAVYDSLFAGSAAGYQVPIWSSASATVNLSGTTIKTATDVETDTQDIQSRLPATLVSGRIDSSVGDMASGVITASSIANDAITDAKVASDVTIASVTGSVGSVASGVTVTTNSDKTGYSLTAGTGLGNQTANITGNLSGSVGSVTSAVTVGTNNDKTGYSLSSAAIQAIWDALTSALTTASSIGKLLVDNINATISSRATQTSVDAIDDFVDTEVAAIKAKTDLIPADIGSVIIAANSNQRTVQVTGSQHIAANIHDSEPNSIHEDAFDDGAITARVIAADAIGSSELAASAITEIQSGLATSSGVTAAFTEIKGSGWSSSTDTLEKIADTTGGGSGSIVVTPVVAQTPVRAVATTITTFKGDRSAITVGVFSGTSPVNLSTLGALEVCIQTKAGTDLQLIAAASITISGTSSNYFSFSPNATAVGTVGRFMWSLRVAASGSKQVIVYGAFVVEDAALAD